MSLNVDVRSVLIVTGSDKIYDFMVDLLPQKEFYPPVRWR